MPWVTNIHKTYRRLDLGEFIIFLLILYFVIGNGDYIEMTTIPKIPKWKFRIFLIL